MAVPFDGEIKVKTSKPIRGIHHYSNVRIATLQLFFDLNVFAAFLVFKLVTERI